MGPLPVGIGSRAVRRGRRRHDAVSGRWCCPWRRRCCGHGRPERYRSCGPNALPRSTLRDVPTWNLASLLTWTAGLGVVAADDSSQLAVGAHTALESQHSALRIDLRVDPTPRGTASGDRSFEVFRPKKDYVGWAVRGQALLVLELSPTPRGQDLRPFGVVGGDAAWLQSYTLETGRQHRELGYNELGLGPAVGAGLSMSLPASRCEARARGLVTARLKATWSGASRSLDLAANCELRR